jgi:hypothetical protein
MLEVLISLGSLAACVICIIVIGFSVLSMIVGTANKYCAMCSNTTKNRQRLCNDCQPRLVT